MSTLELLVEAPDGRREERRFRSGEPIWLGRDPQCDLVLDSHLVSRHHARIAHIDGELLLRDQSVNGTEVDGTLLHHQGRALSPRSLVKIGRTKLWELTRSGKIPAYRVGEGRTSDLRYKKSELLAWLDANLVNGSTLR